MSTNLQSLLLLHRCNVPTTQQDRNDAITRFNVPIDSVAKVKDHPMWQKLYYGEQPKKAREHLAKLAKDFPAEAALFAPAVETMLTAMAEAEVKRLAAKAAMQARRDARAAKAKKKAELGIDLAQKGGAHATEATYKALRAGLNPIEEELRVWLEKTYRRNFETWSMKLAENGWDAGKAFPDRDWRKGTVDTAHVHPPHPHFWKMFTTVRGGERNQVKPDENVDTFIPAEAKRDADEALAGYCGKLAGKVDGAIEEECMGAKVVAADCKIIQSIWNESSLKVELDNGTKQLWHTQVIWNTSVLGKSFNQWPTRRIS